jgi:hypothetical protein
MNGLAKTLLALLKNARERSCWWQANMKAVFASEDVLNTDASTAFRRLAGIASLRKTRKEKTCPISRRSPYAVDQGQSLLRPSVLTKSFIETCTNHQPETNELGTDVGEAPSAGTSEHQPTRNSKSHLKASGSTRYDHTSRIMRMDGLETAFEKIAHR